MHKALCLIGFALLALSALAQTPCSDEIRNFVAEMRAVYSQFPEKPDSNSEADALLEKLGQTEPRLVRQANQLSKQYLALNEDQRVCVVNTFISTPDVNDARVNFWLQHLGKKVPFTLRSPEFKAGFGLHFDLNQGVADLGAGSETYSAAGRALLAWTFWRNGEVTGGRWRVMAGVSAYYQDAGFIGFLNPRVEYRIKDLNLGDLTTIGNLKGIIDVNVGETIIYGAGLGVELHFAGLQVLYQRQRDFHNSHLLIGIFIRAFN